MKTWQKVLLVIIILLLVAAVAAAAWAKPIPPHPFYDQFSSYPLVYAHQGGDGLRPGDTLAAFQNAYDLGVDALEMDVHMSQDTVLVVMHDETVDRTTDGEGYIKDKTLAELKTLDAGYDWSPDGGQTYPFRGTGVQVPALEEVFQTFPGMPMLMEIKQTEPPIYQELCDLIHSYNKENEVLVGSFHDDALAAFRKACPEVATSMSPGEVRPFVYLNLAFLGRFYKPAANSIQVPIESSGIRIITPRFVRTAHGRGLKVEPWTINEQVEMQELIEMGVDGLITDYPDRLLELLNR